MIEDLGNGPGYFFGAVIKTSGTSDPEKYFRNFSCREALGHGTYVHIFVVFTVQSTKYNVLGIKIVRWDYRGSNLQSSISLNRSSNSTNLQSPISNLQSSIF